MRYSGFRPVFSLSTMVLGLLSMLMFRPAVADDWKPAHPINLIVPWAAGGSTDQITRLVASEMEKSLGQTIVIINQPGASGAIGTRSAWEASKDGYTWAAGAAQDLGAYQTLGSLNVPVTDWHLFLSIANVQVIGVNPNTPYQSAKDLLDAMKAQPGKISVATAGVTSAGHNAMELIAKVAGVKYRHVTYDGGNPAVVATVSGEAEVTTQLAVEQADMIRGKRLRPLARSATSRLNSRATEPSRRYRAPCRVSRRRRTISAFSFQRAFRTTLLPRCRRSGLKTSPTTKC